VAGSGYREPADGRRAEVFGRRLPASAARRAAGRAIARKPAARKKTIAHLPAQLAGEWLERIAFSGRVKRDQRPAPTILLRDESPNQAVARP